MTTETYRLTNASHIGRLAVFWLGLLLLISAWVIGYGLVAIMTEALLVPWYCNCTWDTLPAPGTWPRIINDFFDTFPGSHLPALIFVATHISIFSYHLLQAKDKTWLPLSFFGANLLLFLADVWVTRLSWALSDWLAGPRAGGIDAGFHRTWYGLVAHLSLWSVFFVELAKAKLPQLFGSRH